MSFECKECGETFAALKNLHAHLKKHEMYLGDYYVKHYPRYNKLNGNLLQFKNYDDYFAKDFLNRTQMLDWCESAPEAEVKDYLIEILKRRIIKKDLKYAPGTVEMFTSDLPPLWMYRKLFGTYANACKKLDIQPFYTSSLPQSFNDDCNNVKIFIDTREQQPLKFENSEVRKLDVGDYAVGGDLYDYTYVDRKSFGDFCSTVTVSYNRFAKELQRCKDLGSYLFIVTECDMYQMRKQNQFSPKKYNLDYVFHNMRELQHNFKDSCQFVFSGGRKNSQSIIPKLLVNGKKLWNVDVQYYIDQNEIN